jgi:hypothetical protein
VVSGFGWGWPDLSRARELFLLVSGGFCIGLFHPAFGWIVSRRMQPLFAVSLLVGNICLFLIPSHYEWRWVALFLLTNFVLVTVCWLRLSQGRQPLDCVALAADHCCQHYKFTGKERRGLANAIDYVMYAVRRVCK